MNDQIKKAIEIFRAEYPEAVSLRVFINHQEFTVEENHFTGNGISSMRSLNGDWVETPGMIAVHRSPEHDIEVQG